MTDGINLTGFNETKLGNTNAIDGNYSPASGGDFGAGLSWPAAKDVSTQGNAGFNAEGSYDTAGESNAYPESENM